MLHDFDSKLSSADTIHKNKLIYREHELVMELALEHYSKYINISCGITTTKQLKSLIEDIDYSNMNDTDKYMAIYSRYAETFGDNFIMADHISYPSDIRNDVYTNIISQFRTDIKNAFGSSRKAARVLRTLLHGDKNDSELKAEFIKLYSPAYNMTLRDFHLLAWNMAQIGLNTKLQEILFIATCFHDFIDIGITDINATILREDLLEQKIDLRHVCRSYNALFKVGFVTIETGYLLQAIFGLTLDSRCFLSTESIIYLNWDKLIAKWIANYRYIIEKNCSKYTIPKTA